MKIEPFSGLSSPMMDFRSTDFPVPQGPSRAEISPAGSVRVTSDQMFELPKDFERFLMPTSTPATFSLWERSAAAPELDVCRQHRREPWPPGGGGRSRAGAARRGRAGH